MKTNPSEGQYYINQVSDMTGLSKQVIRKWEERYNLLHPTRLPNGYRLYSDEDINILLKIKSSQQQGYSVKQAVHLLSQQQESMDPKKVQVAAQRSSEQSSYVDQLLKEGKNCDEDGLNFLLNQAYHLYGLEFFLQSVVLPFLKEVGNLWERGEWSEYQESFASVIVRDFLVQIRRNVKQNKHAPLVIGACLPYEHHELPVHILLLKFMIRGWRTILVGSSPAPNSIQSIIENQEPKMVMLSASTTFPFEKDPTILEKLDQFAEQKRHIQFFIGGAGAIAYLKEKPLQNIHLAHSIGDILD